MVDLEYPLVVRILRTPSLTVAEQHLFGLLDKGKGPLGGRFEGLVSGGELHGGPQSVKPNFDTSSTKI